MKVLFIIDRINYYRIIAPLIQEFLSSGHSVDCAHDYSKPMSKRRLDECRLEWTPIFDQDKNFHPFSFIDNHELFRKIENDGYDYVFTISLSHAQEAYVKSMQFCKWVCIPPFSDDWILMLVDVDTLDSIDYFLLQSEYWLERNVRFLKELFGWFGEEEENKFRSKAKCLGWIQGDQTARVDKERTYCELGIPPDKKVVLWFNFSVDVTRFSWKQQLFTYNSTSERIKYILKNCRNPIKAWVSFFEVHIGDLLNMVREYCWDNNACLVMKYRNRDKILTVEREKCDYFFNDIAYYPSINNKLLAITDLCVSPFSLAARDAAAEGIPSIVHDFHHIMDATYYEMKTPMYKSYEEEYGYMNFPNLIDFTRCKEEFRELLFSRDLKSRSVPESSVRDYTNTFIGEYGVSASERMVSYLADQLAKY